MPLKYSNLHMLVDIRCQCIKHKILLLFFIWCFNFQLKGIMFFVVFLILSMLKPFWTNFLAYVNLNHLFGVPAGLVGQC